jgi:hypothetical protein
MVMSAAMKKAAMTMAASPRRCRERGGAAVVGEASSSAG